MFTDIPDNPEEFWCNFYPGGMLPSNDLTTAAPPDLGSRICRRMMFPCINLICSYSSDSGDSSDNNDDNDSNDRHEEIRLAHFSVKEYLVSERIHDQTPTFSTSVISGNLFIMESCIQYVFQYHKSQSKSFPPSDLKEFPLLEYSCGHWYLHGREVPLECQKQLEPLVFRFFLSEALLLTWVQVYHPDHLWIAMDGQRYLWQPRRSMRRSSSS